MLRTFGTALVIVGLVAGGVGFAVGDSPAGETCRSGDTTTTAPEESATSQNGPWRAPTVAQDTTPLNCVPGCPMVSGSAGTCLERKLTTGLYGTPPAGGGEYACCCVYTYYENGESETVVYVDPACDRRVHKDSDGNPMPWNGAGGASDFSCVGSCVAGAHTCQVDVLSGPTQDGAVWKRKSKCNCQ